MPAKLLEITATYRRERHRFPGTPSDTIIGDVTVTRNGSGEEFPSAVKGPAEESDLQPHQTYRFYGHWTQYDNKRTGIKEKQFQFKTFVRVAPHTRAGVVGYLDKAPGIGRVLAARLFDKFGSDAVKVLREQPDVAAAACDRLSLDAAKDAAEWLEGEKALEGCTIELIDLLDGRGFRKAVAKEAVKEWGNRAAQIIRQNPYRLMQFRGCGFKLADALYLDLGGRPAALKRQSLCAWHALASNSSGDTWHWSGVAEQGIKGSVGGADVEFLAAVRLACRGGLLASIYTDGRNGGPTWDGDVLWLADARKAQAERRVAELVARAMGEKRGWPEFDFAAEGLTEHQAAEFYNATERGEIGILGGSPGTGKTYTAAVSIRQLVEEFGVDSICVCAPTGKAAVRISEAMAAHSLPIVARTIHATLGVDQVDSRDGWSFQHNAANPLPERFIVVDESSMIDASLMASLLAARARGSFILFIGDVNQLPPVGHGAPLRDMIAAGVPYGELREIKRNDGGIVQACADMRDGKVFQCRGNLVNAAAGSPQRQAEVVLETIAQAATENVNPVWDCQVLVAVNRRSKVSRKEVNAELQKHLNHNPIVPGSPFRLADKVVNTRNRFYPPADRDQPLEDESVANDKGDIYVANGELGRVTRVEPKFLEVALTGPDRLIRVPRGSGSDDDGENADEASGTGCDWDLAYALSVHKSQGSEWPIVIVLVDEYPGARSICDRAWLYTAISRAKEVCYLVGRKLTADRFCRANNISKRKTFLRELIGEELQRAKRESERGQLCRA